MMCYNIHSASNEIQLIGGAEFGIAFSFPSSKEKSYAGICTAHQVQVNINYVR